MFWDADDKILKSVLAAIILDLVLAGSELFHKVRLYFLKDTKVEDQVSVIIFFQCHWHRG